MNGPFSFSSVVSPLQQKTLSAGTNDTVYLLKIGSGMLAWITSVGNNLLLDSSKNVVGYFKWNIDNRLVENVKRVIANINNPYVYNPPIGPIKRSIRWIGYNTDSSVSWEATVVCDGIIYPKNYRFK